ncbi:MAG: transporter, YjgP/YjgQ family [Candidatus Angelobacter sp.]|nr:transporter, YjgP/YjgQ family [Candidatus Angelobacter sp.]
MLDSFFTKLTTVRILTRYVLKEVVSHAALGAAVFTFVIFMKNLGTILELIVRNSAPLPSVAELFFLTLPTALIYTLPMAVLVGILIGLSRLASDSEVTAMRASGIGAGTFVSMISVFAVAVWLLAITNSVIVAPRSAAALVRLQDSLKNSQASFAVQPRVFYENFPNYVLYVQDVKSSSSAALWSNVFLADIRNPAAPKITIAERAIVVNEDHNTIRLHLMNGSQHESSPRSPEQYNITTFAETDIPIEIPTADSQKQREPPAAEMLTTELLRKSNDGGAEKGRDLWYLTEFHRRLALPTACLVLSLVGIPLGLSSKKGGKSTGFVLTIVLVFIYYFLLAAGVALSRQGKVPPALGVWMANFVFAITGLVLLRRVDYSSLEVGTPIASFKAWILGKLNPMAPEPVQREERRAAIRVQRAPSGPNRFPLILDNYILRTFLSYLGLVLASFIVLTLVFTFFELLGDIIRNRVPLVTVAAYLLNVTPSMIYVMTPLSVLIAVLVTFGLMQKSNELTAMKATGISIYRAIIPVLTIAAGISVALFFFDQFYLPYANTRQEAIRNSIKGRPPQTFMRPDRKWIFGEKDVIYYYQHFDAEQNEFANISAFQFDPTTFSITRRVYATRAHWVNDLNKWVFEQGWSRRFNGAVVDNYRQFDVTTFAEFAENPNYFKKEVKQSSEMNYSELRLYIQDLQQSGFDVIRLRVQLQKKLAYPLIALVMAILAVPFSLSAGKRGALTGVAVALGIAVIYLVTSNFFEALGNVNQLPSALAAWAPDLLFGLAGGYLIFKVPT